MEKHRPGTLVVDADKRFLASLRESLRKGGYTKNIEPWVARTGQEALTALKTQDNQGVPLVAAFINPKVSHPGGVKLIAQIRRTHPGVPIYVIHDGEAPFSERELSRLAVKGISKEELGQRMGELVDLSAHEGYLAKNQAPAKEEEGYLAVPIKTFLSGAQCFFDVFVKLPSGKFLKILNAKDSFTGARLKKYYEAGVHNFYLKKASHEACLVYCDYLAKRLLESDGVSDEIKLSHICNSGDELIERVRNRGVDGFHVEYTLKFLGDVVTMTRGLDLTQSKVLKNFVEDLAAHEHAVGTTFVSALVSLALKMESASAVRTVGLASFLHDVGLYELGVDTPGEGMEGLDEAGVSLFQSHPLVGAEVLRQVQGIDEAAIQAVAQHHERKDKSGYPRGLSGASITRVAEIVGLADEVSHHLAENPGKPYRPKKGAFSDEVVAAYLKVFG